MRAHVKFDLFGSKMKFENIFIYFRLIINYDYGTTFIRQRQNYIRNADIVWFDWSEQLSPFRNEFIWMAAESSICDGFI